MGRRYYKIKNKARTVRLGFKKREIYMQNILVVIDMQNDFIDGSLGTKEAVAIVPAVKDKINSFDGKIYFTRDTHDVNYLGTQEGKKLPVEHCIKNSFGWQISEALDTSRAEKIIDKPTFGSTELSKELCRENEREKISKITLVGICTDICVISNAMLLKAAMPEVKIAVDAVCCAGVTPESHENALNAMRMCQIEIEE